MSSENPKAAFSFSDLGREPIVYESKILIRFNDLDLNGHVNSSIYLDLLTTARFDYVRKHFGVTFESLAAQNIGFYMTQSTIRYRLPIEGLQTVLIRSQIVSVGEKRFTLEFEILSEDGKRRFADGATENAVIDLVTRRSIALPEYTYDWFSKKKIGE